MENDDRTRSKLDILYRLDFIEDKCIIYVQSAIMPVWEKLHTSYLVSTNEGQANPAVKQITKQYQSLVKGMVLSFRLRANPTRKIATKTGFDGKRRNGRRVDLRREIDQKNWLLRKGTLAGFDLMEIRITDSVEDVRLVPEGRTTVKVTGKRGSSKITFGTVLFDGHLKITDAELFRDALRSGIGSAKAYGCGLLSIGPPRMHT